MDLLKMLKIGIINVSDRASFGVYEDLPGQEVRKVLNQWLSVDWQEAYAVIPDEQNLIEQTLVDFSDNQKCSLIFTTGGTGPAVRDVTPEATDSVCSKSMPGFGEWMRAKSMEIVPTAILSRQTAGIRGKCLIVNLPGKPKAILECMEVVFPAIPYCVDLIEGARIETNADQMKVFRPKSS
jgi:molybdopterin adenylyltransferase